LSQSGLTYVVPVIYAYDCDGLYVASIEGQKASMMRENPSVCFEVDEYDGAGAAGGARLSKVSTRSSRARTLRLHSRSSPTGSAAPTRKAAPDAATGQRAPAPSASASAFGK